MSATATETNSSYLLRKLHSLTGVVPVGAFLAEHFWSNSAALVSAQKYNQTSEDLQTIPYRIFVEWLFIFLFLFCSNRCTYPHLTYVFSTESLVFFYFLFLFFFFFFFCVVLPSSF